MAQRITGHYAPGSLAGSRYQAFIPDPLPRYRRWIWRQATCLPAKSAPTRR